MTIASDLARSAPTVDRGADLQPHHRQDAFAIFDNDLAQIDLAKARHGETMSHALDPRATRFHLFDASTKKSSVRPSRLQILTGLKWILRYFAELSLFRKLFCSRLERWHALKKFGIQFHRYWASRNPEVFELAPHHCELALILIGMVLGVHAGNDAIGGEHVHDVQALYRGGDQRVVAVIVGLESAGNVRIPLAERNELAKLKILDARTAMATNDGKRTRRLYVNGRMERAGKMSAVSMRASTIVKHAEGLGTHAVTF